MQGLIFLVRSPEPGVIKTRLARLLGKELTQKLYRAFVLDMMATLASFSSSMTLHYDGNGEAIKKWLGEGYAYFPQKGDDIGQRMAKAFAEEFKKGMEKVVLVGSDIPQLSLDTINRAFSLLEEKDAVLGRAVDGGYYLIGLRKGFNPVIFENIPWSGGEVFSRTIGTLEGLGKSVGLVTEERDMDEVADLIWLSDHSALFAGKCPRTLELLKIKGDRIAQEGNKPFDYYNTAACDGNLPSVRRS